MSLVDSLARQGWLRAVDHEFALTLRRLRPDTHELVLAGAALASRALAFGHGGLPLDRLPALFAEIAAERDPPPLPPAEDWRAPLRESPWVRSTAPQPDLFANAEPAPLVLDGERLYLRRYHDYETRLAAALLARTGGVDDADAVKGATDAAEARLAELFPAAAGDAGDAQAAAARAFRRARLLLLTGGPGTGKTTTVARALVLRVEHALQRGQAAPRIVLAAPTGKAAARLAEAVRGTVERLRLQGLLADAVAQALPAQASTLHRLLGWRSDSVRFRHDARHPWPADNVVVDEATMVDLPLMCKLVEAVSPDAALLLIGDRDQLPSVETGDVLAALCDAADGGGALAPHRVALTRIWRQHDDIDVGRLAAWVRDGHTDAALDALHAQTLRGIDWLPARERSPWRALEARALHAYRDVAAAPSPAEALQRAKRIRLLTAVREGPAGSQLLNAQIAQALQPPGLRGERFFHGALLMVTENSYRHGLFNGDIGVCWQDGEALRVWFERDAEGGDALRAWLPSALPAHEPAFALTVHKSQGSEFDDVLLVLPPGGGASRALSRELLYTGLTRCRRSLLLWADEAALRAAIGRPAQRWSGLADRLA
jgi:exodeoxyribonuclease V alpha subunit